MYRIIDGFGYEQEVDTRFEDCDHADYDYEGADRSVGIMTESAWCAACGAVATDLNEEIEYDEDGPCGYRTGAPLWVAPEYLGTDEGDEQ
jgi:hypothetical protein